MARRLGNEVGWWCPSLDPNGDGTATLTGFGTLQSAGLLQNMDPGTDWVADAANGGSRAIDVVAADEWIDTQAPHIQGAAQWSLSGWFYIRSLATNIYLLGAFNGANRRSLYWLVLSTGRMAIVWGDGTNESPSTTGSGTLLSTGQWYHLAVINNGSTLTRYVNGAAYGNATNHSVGAISLGSLSLWIAGLNRGDPTDSSPFDGRWDDLRIFDRAITTDELALLASMRGYQPDPPPTQPRILSPFLIGDVG